MSLSSAACKGGQKLRDLRRTYHETIHWVGHESRLDTLKDYFTDRRARAREELRAELGAATIGAMTGLPPFHLEDHAAYCADWAELVKDEPRAFLSAAAKAQAAVDWLIERGGPPDHDPCKGRGNQANGGGAGFAGAAACSGKNGLGETNGP